MTADRDEPSAFTFEQQVAVAKSLRRIAKMIDKELAKAGAPRMPWSLFTWGGHRGQYVSNVERKHARLAIQETLERWGEISDVPMDQEFKS